MQITLPWAARAHSTKTSQKNKNKNNKTILLHGGELKRNTRLRALTHSTSCSVCTRAPIWLFAWCRNKSNYKSPPKASTRIRTDLPTIVQYTTRPNRLMGFSCLLDAALLPRAHPPFFKDQFETFFSFDSFLRQLQNSTDPLETPAAAAAAAIITAATAAALTCKSNSNPQLVLVWSASNRQTRRLLIVRVCFSSCPAWWRIAFCF